MEIIEFALKSNPRIPSPHIHFVTNESTVTIKKSSNKMEKIHCDGDTFLCGYLVAPNDVQTLCLTSIILRLIGLVSNYSVKYESA